MLIKIKQNRKWGYYNTETKYEIPCIYEDADTFKNGYAIVKANYNEYHIIDEFGNKINRIPFTGIELHSPGVYKVRYKNIEHDSFINQSGDFVTSYGEKLPESINIAEFIAPLIDDIYLIYNNDILGLFHLTKGSLITNLQYVSRLNDELFVISFNESKLRGVCNTSGEIIVPLKYSSISIIDSNLILASENSWYRAGDIYNYQGQRLFYTNSKIESIGNGLYRIFYNDEKSFVYNSTLDEVCFNSKTPNPIHLEHLYYSEFIDGYSVIINKDHKYGLIDIENNVVINCDYEDIYIENGLAYVAKDKDYRDYQGYNKSKKVYGIIDLKDFTTIVECQFDTISSFVNHHAKVTQDYRSGYINDKGEITIKLTHDKISETENPDVVQLTRTGSYPNIRYQFITGEYAFIDTQGHFVVLPKEYEVCGDLSEGRILVRHNSQYNYAYADESGKIVIRLNSNIKGSTFNGEYASIWIDRRSHRDYDESEKCSINKFGAFVVPDGVSEVIINNSALSYIKPFEYGIARAYKDYKWGLIDKLGNFICEPKFDEISKFVDHQAIATIKDDSKRKYCIINDRGELLIEYYFDDIELINGEYYSTNIGDISKNGKFIANGKEVDFTYDTCFSTEDGYISVSLENKKGALSNDGNRILNCEYENITYIEKDYLLCQKDNSSLLFNLSSNESIQLPLNIKVCKVISSSLIEITLTSGKHQIINTFGEVVYDDSDISVIDAYIDLLIFTRGQGNKVGLLSIQNGVILEDIFHSICFDKSTNSILVIKDKGSHCQRYDYSGNKVALLGNTLIPLADIYEACGDYSCGLAKVKRSHKISKLDISKVISLKPYQDIDDGFGFLLREEPDILGNLDWMNFNEDIDSDVRTWGYIDITGEEVIACQFKEAFDFSEGLAAVSYFDHFGFINKYGLFVTPRKYEKVRSFHEGYAAVKEGFNWTFIQENGQVTLNTRETEVYDVYSNIIRYKSYNNGYGFINFDGERIISNLFYAEDFVNGRARVKINETSDYFTINSDGNYIFNIDNTEVLVNQYWIDFDKVKYLPDQKVIITINKNGQKGLITPKGITLPTIYPTLRISEDKTHLIANYFGSNTPMNMSFEGGFIILDKDGNKLTLRSEYRWCEKISEHAYIVTTTEFNHGVVNDEGVEIIPCIYQEINVSKDNLHFHCVRYGNYFRPFENYTPDCDADFQDWDENGNSFMRSYDTHYYKLTYNIHGAQVILNYPKETIIPKKYIATGETFHDGLCPVLDKQGWGFINEQGIEIIPCRYDIYSDFKEGRSIVHSDDGWSVLNTKGETIVEGSDYQSISEFSNEHSEITFYSFASRDKEGNITYEKRCINREGQLHISINERSSYLPIEYKWYNIVKNQIQVFNGEYWGLLDTDLNLVIPCIYKSPFLFESTFYNANSVLNAPKASAIIESSTGYGLINTLGEEIIPCIYESLTRSKSGLFSLHIKYFAKHKGLKLHSIYDDTGKLLTTLPCESIESISHDYNKFKIIDGYGQFGIIKNNGQIIFAGLDEVGKESNNVIPIKLAKKRCYINNKRQLIGLDKNFTSTEAFTNALGIVSIDSGKYHNLFGAIDVTGKYVIPPVYDSLKYGYSSYKAEYSINTYIKKEVNLNNEGQILVVDQDGIPHAFSGYHFCQNVYENIFIVARDGKVGFVDSDGNILIPLKRYPELLDLPYFDNGHYYIKESTKRIYTNREARCFEIHKDGRLITWKSDEKILIPNEYTWASFWEGEYLPVMKDNAWGIIDIKFNAVSSFEYSCILGIKGNNAIAMKKDGTLYKLDLQTYTSLGVQYSYSEMNSKFIVIIKKLIEDRGYFSNKEKYLYGIIDFAGNEIIECKYDNITFDGFKLPEERSYIYDEGYSDDELESMYRDAFEDDPDAQWNIW